MWERGIFERRKGERGEGRKEWKWFSKEGRKEGRLVCNE